MGSHCNWYLRQPTVEVLFKKEKKEKPCAIKSLRKGSFLFLLSETYFYDISQCFKTINNRSSVIVRREKEETWTRNREGLTLGCLDAWLLCVSRG